MEIITSAYGKSQLTNTNLTTRYIKIAENKGFHNNENNFLKSSTSLMIIILIAAINIIDNTDAIVAPIASIIGINNILKAKLDTAPIVVVINNSLSFFTETRYCHPIILLAPINSTIGLSKVNNTLTFSYPFPKKIFTNGYETADIPKIIGRESKKLCYEVCSAEMIAKLICLVCFIMMPTTLTRPEITGTGFWNYCHK